MRGGKDERNLEETNLMSNYWVLLLFGGYIILLRWVLPRFGVQI
jgi:hypothetical protein